MNTLTYTYDNASFEAQITRVTDGIIYCRTIQPNGDLTEEHSIPAAEVQSVVITIESLKGIRGDVNKRVSNFLKSAGLSVLNTKVQILCEREPGRTWIKPAGKPSCVAYG